MTSTVSFPPKVTRIYDYDAGKDYASGAYIWDNGTLYKTVVAIAADTLFNDPANYEAIKTAPDGVLAMPTGDAYGHINQGEAVRLRGDGTLVADRYARAWAWSSAAASHAAAGSSGVSTAYCPATSQYLMVWRDTSNGFAVKYKIGVASAVGMSFTVTWGAENTLDAEVCQFGYIWATYDSTADAFIVVSSGTNDRIVIRQIKRSGASWTVQPVNYISGNNNYPSFVCKVGASSYAVFFMNGSGTYYNVISPSANLISVTGSSTLIATNIGYVTAALYEGSPAIKVVSGVNGSSLTIRSLNTSTGASSSVSVIASGSMPALYSVSGGYILAYTNLGGEFCWRFSNTGFSYSAERVHSAAGIWYPMNVQGTIALLNTQGVMSYIYGAQYADNTLELTVQGEVGIGESVIKAAVAGGSSAAWLCVSQSTNYTIDNPITLEYRDSTKPVAGIAQEAATNAQTFTYAAVGQISSVHAGLTPGAEYNNVNGSPSLSGSQTLGRAISATELLITASSASSPISGAVLDNALDVAAIVVPGRYIVPASDTTGVFVGNENSYADYDGTLWTFTVPASGDKVQVASGVNVGAVIEYSGTAWAQSAGATGVPIYDYNVTAEYKLNDGVILNNSLFRANAAIPANTAFAIGTTGATWRQVGISGAAEYGEVQLANGTTSAAVYPAYASIATFTLPSAGTWEIDVILSINGAANSGLRTRLESQTNGVITNSETTTLYSATSIVGGPSVATIRYTTVGAETISLAACKINATAVSLYNSYDGRSAIKWKKIAGYLPVSGAMCDYGQYLMTGLQSTANAKIGLSMSDGNLPVVNDTITLKAGNTYTLTASLAIWSTYYTYKWWDETAGAFIGVEGFCASANSTDGGSYCPATAVVRPTADRAYSLRVVGNAGVNGGQTALDIRYSTVNIRQLGASPQVAPPASSPKIGTDSSSNFTAMAKSAIVGRGVEVQLGNLKVRIPSSGNVSLQVATASGTMSITGSAVWIWAGNQTNGSNTAAPQAVTTAFSYLAPSANFTSAASSERWLLMDDTSGLAWSVSSIYGYGYTKNLISIERLV